MKDENGVNPDEDCGTERCIYACESCPFGIPENVENNAMSIEC